MSAKQSLPSDPIEELDALARDIAFVVVPSSDKNRVVAARVLDLFSMRIAAVEQVYARTVICSAIAAEARSRADSLGLKRAPSAEGLRRALYLRGKVAGPEARIPDATKSAAYRPAATTNAAQKAAPAPAGQQLPAIQERLERGERLNRRRQAVRS